MENYVGMSAEFIDSINTKKNDMYEAHSHDFYEIYYFLGSEMTFFMDSTPIVLCNQDLLLVDKHIFHRTKYSGDVSNRQFVNISFNEGFLRRYFDSATIDEMLPLFGTPLLVSSQNPALPRIDDLIRSACSAYAKKDKCDLLCASHTLCLILVELLQNAGSFIEVPLADGLSSGQSLISQVARFINMYYSEKITLTSLANQFFVSKYYLSHAFKQTVGINITDFINRKRTDEAAYLLENSDMSLADIANLVGFNSLSYFIESFKQYHNTTPMRYRIQKADMQANNELAMQEVSDV